MKTNLYIPRNSFLKKNNTLGIWLSGGADSSILCYLLAKYIKENSLDYKIQPVAILKRQGDTAHLDVLNFIKQKLTCDHLFLNIIVHNPKNKQEYNESFSNVRNKHVIDGRYNYIYSGINQSPDAEAYTNGWNMSPEVQNIRGSIVNKLKILCGVIELNGVDYEFGDIRPFIMMNKKEIANIYKQYNLLNSLFPLTNSCGGHSTANTHCEKCWNCRERLWAFGKF
jgi:7-cyano-7-deazaguanine synthase in queuosine biosynthesis